MTIYFGEEAVRELEKELGRHLRYEEHCVVWLEAFADEPYKDTKGIWTNRVGQTGEWLNRPFVDAFLHHEMRVKNRIPDYRGFPIFLRGELMQAEYRGDLGHSPKTCNLINARQFETAAVEFLDHDEYRTGPAQIRRRIKRVALALELYGLQQY